MPATTEQKGKVLLLLLHDADVLHHTLREPVAEAVRLLGSKIITDPAARQTGLGNAITIYRTQYALYAAALALVPANPVTWEPTAEQLARLAGLVTP